MDVFSHATDYGDMDARRASLLKAAKFGHLTLTASLAAAAAPYVRLGNERGEMADEKERFNKELDAIAEFGPLRPASQIMPVILATWANLDSFYVANSEISALKAKAAIFAGDRSITLEDSVNGYRWFSLAQRYARMTDDSGLISLAHAREALARLYWGGKPRHTIADAKLALQHAINNEQKGMAYMMYARTIADLGQRQEAVLAVRKAVELADDVKGQSPRPDRWIRPMAHTSAARALSQFPESLPAVEEHAREAMAGLPKKAVQNRTHACFSIAAARVRIREYDGAAQMISDELSALPEGHLQPILIRQILEIIKQAETQDPHNAPMRRLREQLATLTT